MCSLASFLNFLLQNSVMREKKKKERKTQYEGGRKKNRGQKERERRIGKNREEKGD